MSQTFIIPVSNTPTQFEITLGTNDYILTCKFNDADDAGWVLDFDDALTGDSILHGVPLVTGVDLLDGLAYLGFQGSLIVNTNGDTFAVPTIDNLGVQSFLYFVTSVASGS